MSWWAALVFLMGVLTGQVSIILARWHGRRTALRRFAAWDHRNVSGVSPPLGGRRRGR